jgi:hypothetical protein
MNYWFCSNSPLYQEFLRGRPRLAMSVQPDGFHIDDYGGTTGSLWQGGCFCDNCMAGFRKYLADQVPAEKLRPRSIAWKDAADLLAPVRPWLRVEGERKTWALPRQVPGSRPAALAIHLLNRSYDFAADRTAPQNDVVLHVAKPLLGRNAAALKATLYAPGVAPATIPVEQAGDELVARVPELRLWSILKLD